MDVLITTVAKYYSFFLESELTLRIKVKLKRKQIQDNQVPSSSKMSAMKEIKRPSLQFYLVKIERSEASLQFNMVKIE